MVKPSVRLALSARRFFKISPPSFVVELPEDALQDAETLRTLLGRAQQASIAPISDFHVGAVAIGGSGKAYLGTNLEFAQQPLSQTVHAEQFAVVLARHYGETVIRKLIVSALPCGHCRQFLQELHQPDLPIVCYDDTPAVKSFLLSDLMPMPFTLNTSRYGLLVPSAVFLKTEGSFTRTPLTQKAVEAASQAYVPYTRGWSGVALSSQNDELYWGSTLESAAYNPTLTAFQAALVHYISQENTLSQIKSVVLVEAGAQKVSLEKSVGALLKSLSPKADFLYIKAFPEAL